MGDFVRVADAAQIGEASMGAFEVGGERIAVANVGGSFHAFGNTCTHRQCFLALGELDGTVVTCPCHGSRFDAGGAPLKGPAVRPLRRLPLTLRAGVVEVKRS